MHRRNALKLIAGTGLAGLLPTRAFAQAPPAKKEPAPAAGFDTAKIATSELRGGVHLLTGPGGNIAFVPGDTGTLIVDCGIPGRTDAITEAIAAVTPKPLRLLVNTHWHFDHTGGNAALGGAGVAIAAHENTRKRMSVDHTIEISTLKMKSPASPPAALPTITFKQALELHQGGDDIHLEHVPPAHTDTDIFIHFRKANVLHMGDTFFNTGAYPFIDITTGGTLPGMIAAADKGLKMADKETKIIPGHGPVGGTAELKAYRDFLADIHEIFKKLIDAGKTLPEAVAAKPLAKYDAKYGMGFIQGDLGVAMFYGSMKK